MKNYQEPIEELDKELRSCLFKEGPIVGQHGDEEAQPEDENININGLKIGDLK